MMEDNPQVTLKPKDGQESAKKSKIYKNLFTFATPQRMLM